MSLSDWLARGWLTRYEPNAREIADLFGLIDRDRADCRASALSADWRLSIAYNAALQAATAALAAAGFRPAGRLITTGSFDRSDSPSAPTTRW